MKTSFKTWLAALAIVGLVTPVQAYDSPSHSRSMVTDVALTSAGELAGSIVTPDGKPSIVTPVHVLYKQAVVAQVKTDARGRYLVKGLRPGLHTIRTVNGQAVCRFWSAETAPPKAHKRLELTSDNTILRGQDEGLFSGVNSGTLIGAGVFAGTAVAVATSVAGNDDAKLVLPSAPASP